MPLKVVGFWDANVVATPPSEASSLTFTLQLGNALQKDIDNARRSLS